MEFRALRRDDDRAGFSCGHAELDEFLRRFAWQNQHRNLLGVTYVLAEERTILGFVTVAAHSLTQPEARRELRLNVPVLPVLLIARMGVDRSKAGQGLGTRLIRGCCELAAEQARRVGCVGLVADAKATAVGFYQRLGFSPLEAPNPEGTQLHLLATRHFIGLTRGELG